jgi:hypothetical protein
VSQQRRHHEQEAIGTRRHHHFLDEQLQHVGERLQQALGADPVRADAHLHVADHLALGERQVGHAEDHDDRDGQDLAERR